MVSDVLTYSRRIECVGPVRQSADIEKIDLRGKVFRAEGVDVHTHMDAPSGRWYVPGQVDAFCLGGALPRGGWSVVRRGAGRFVARRAA
ncbi:hypothetical protein ACN28G_09365 [Micromonospora sp. WMMA1923]|uniref:hypothetical protein n=1 Tax=Micromonospora sp. WMMA1923 TaxID=3404125 RepID=UPI003B92B22F